MSGLSASAIELQVARQEITDRIYQYCRGCDRGDAELLFSVFWPDATIEHPPYQGGVDGFCKAALEFIRAVDVSLHQVSNVLIEFDGADFAYTESHFTGYHRLAKGLVLDGPIGEVIGPYHDNDIDEDHFVGGRYIKWFERRKGVWKVVHHIGFREWERWEPAADRYPVPMMGRRDRSDPSYLRRTTR